VAEIKQASPSAGLLRADFDVEKLSTAYARGGAQALSVLTEREHFGGGLADLERAAGAELPLLQKDFVLSEYQVLEGRAAGADAVLLISEALAAERARELARVALDLGMDVLYEAHDPANIRRVAGLAERDPERVLVGVNNRNLRTFEVTLETSLAALRELPRWLFVVAESGIRSGEDLRRLRDAGARAALVGETLMRAPDVETATRALVEPLLEA
jgi:indole-3-glycerol phosphate synthase